MCVFYDNEEMVIEAYYTEEDICTISALEVHKMGHAQCDQIQKCSIYGKMLATALVRG